MRGRGTVVHDAGSGQQNGAENTFAVKGKVQRVAFETEYML